MKRSAYLLLAILAASLLFCRCGSSPGAPPNDYPVTPVPFTDVRFTDDFWLPRLVINQRVTIPIALRHCYATGRVDNFKKAGGIMEGFFNTGYTFDDTDIYKIIEGASYSLQIFPDPGLEKAMDSLIRFIALAQEEDGYLFTPRTAMDPENPHRWLNENRWELDPDLSHETYNSGHLFEAAIAHYQATGKRSLLEIAVKNADLLVREFGPGKLAFEPGHQIVEMGLVKMYRATGNTDYLELAQYFLDLKGNGFRGAYCQSHLPVIEQREAVGHAVRATYMYSGMADIAAIKKNEDYLHAIDAIWDDVVSKKYYLTGGIGALHQGEAFGEDYHLPNETAYCETCAAIGNVYWNHRLFLLHGESKYIDVLERTLYNGVLSGISLEGDRFFYPNPLASEGGYSRSEWFGCACCPSNLCRFVPSVPGYVYARRGDDLFVNLYVAGKAEIATAEGAVNITQETDYPWDGRVRLRVDPAKPRKLTLKLRIPGWAQDRPVPSDLYAYSGDRAAPVTLRINGQPHPLETGADGYASLHRKWTPGDLVELDFPMDVRQVSAHENVAENRDKTAFERGPVVYCFESEDNPDLWEVTVPARNEATGVFRSDKLSGIYELTVDGRYRNDPSRLAKLTAVPYYSWANRGAGAMKVWMPLTPDTYPHHENE